MARRQDYTSIRRAIIDEYDKTHRALRDLWSSVIRAENARPGAVEWYTNLVIGIERISEVKYVLDENLRDDCDRLIVTSHMVISSQDIVWQPLCDEASINCKLDNLLDRVETLIALLEK
jgi:hypothetical protein